MYRWAKASASMWFGGDAPFAPLVQAAAEVAAWHLQHMADISRVNKLLVKQGRRKLPYPRFGSIATAVEVSEVFLGSMIQSVRRQSSQQQQQGDQAGSDTLSIPPEVERILQDSDRYRELLLLSATVLGSEALQLERLVCVGSTNGSSLCRSVSSSSRSSSSSKRQLAYTQLQLQ
jgi:hypothetical protein